MKITDKILLTILLLFGAITLFMSGSVIFDLFGIRELEGNYVGFIVWTNFISSILYIITALDYILNKKWNWRYIALSLLILILSSIALWFYIDNGGIHEEQTINAMIFRTIFTSILLVSTFIKHNEGLKK